MASTLGLSAYYQDSAAAFVNAHGEIVAAAQEERFTRIKHDYRFPKKAARYCLEEAGLEIEQLDYVAFYDKPLQKFDRLIETCLAFAPRCPSPPPSARTTSPRPGRLVGSGSSRR